MLLILILIVLCFLLFSPAGRMLHFEGSVRKLLHDISEARRQAWRNADALGRERIVRFECGWRAIGRVAVAGTLLTGAVATASPVLAIACTVTAWRVIKPSRQEMRDACMYRSSGCEDEPPYQWSNSYALLRL